MARVVSKALLPLKLDKAFFRRCISEVSCSGFSKIHLQTLYFLILISFVNFSRAMDNNKERMRLGQPTLIAFARRERGRQLEEARVIPSFGS